MVYDVAHFISKACSCVKKKRPSKLDVAPFQCIITSAPMELICLDFLHLDQGGRDCRYLLVVTAHFSGFTQGHPTINKKGKTTAECISNDFKLIYGMHKFYITKVENLRMIYLKRCALPPPPRPYPVPLPWSAEVTWYHISNLGHVEDAVRVVTSPRNV